MSWVELQVTFWVNPVSLVRSDLDLIILLFVLEDHFQRRGEAALGVPAKSCPGSESSLLRVDIVVIKTLSDSIINGRPGKQRGDN